MESEGGRHALCHAGGEFGNAVLNVVEVRVAGPSAQFLDHVVVVSV